MIHDVNSLARAVAAGAILGGVVLGTFSTTGQADCASFVADRKIAVDQLFTHRWRLDQAEEAYRLFDAQTTGKGVFLM